MTAKPMTVSEFRLTDAEIAKQLARNCPPYVITHISCRVAPKGQSAKKRGFISRWLTRRIMRAQGVRG